MCNVILLYLKLILKPPIICYKEKNVKSQIKKKIYGFNKINKNQTGNTDV